MIGGLSLFLFGMTVLSSGLEKLSGGKLEKLLEKLSGNLFKGVLLGTVVTGLIQSSSTTTVMVVGFVNSGIMRLKQAVGVIMGANIGTTITAWLLSIIGLQSDNIIIKFLKPSSLSTIVAAIGIILYMSSKREKRRSVGQLMLGFSVLMFGMMTMSNAAGILAENPKLAEIFTMFSNPIFGILAGILVTALIQSSSASVGILQALSATGAITFSSALPIIMGQNIGTCITALLSSIGASKNGKRTAMIHLYFNLIGTIIFIILAYTINSIVHFAFWNENVNPLTIAVIHSIFNITSTILLLPFAKTLEKLAILTIKDKETKKVEKKQSLLDERFLQSPSYAISQCVNTVNDMANSAIENYQASYNLIKQYSPSDFEAIVEKEDKIDLMEDALGTYLIKLTDIDLTLNESKQVSKLLHSISDFERIADHAMNIADLAQSMNKKSIIFSEKAQRELQIFNNAVEEILGLASVAFRSDDYEIATMVEPLEDIIDMICTELKNQHINRLRTGDCTIDAGIVFLDLLNDFERIADHCSNLAVYVIELKDEKLDAHKYLKSMHAQTPVAYTQLAEQFKQKYFDKLGEAV